MNRVASSISAVLVLSPITAFSQAFDILSFDPTATGPWSDRAKTTLVAPKVANGSIKLDGQVSAQEYGGFEGVTVTPGDNAWILDFPDDRSWSGAADSSFTFWLAHDDDHLYVGIQAKDDVINSDDPNASFWKDDSIEIVVDALNDRYDNNTDNSKDPFGGHSYVNFQGRFSAWDEGAGKIGTATWATSVDWKYGENGDVFGFGQPAAGGWHMEVRFKKRMFEDPKAGNKLRNGARMGFNIGMDDDDKKGPGANGNKSRTQDLEIQYWWANRQRREGLNADTFAFLTPEELQSKSYLSLFPLIIDSAGRLSHAATGEIFFGYDARSEGEILFVTSNGDSPINADVQIISLLKAKGYKITNFNASGSTPEGLREAAQGKKLVILSETIGSTSVLDPAGSGTGVFSLKNSDVPVISFEPYMYDNADWTKRTEDGSNDWINWGNTGRSEVAAEVQDARDSLYIRKADHPIAGGLTGKVKVYTLPYSLNYGLPSADADVIASAQADGTFPTIFVYDKGDKLADGSVAPNKRIGFFFGQNANPNANTPLAYEDFTEEGKALFLNTVAYAIGVAAKPVLALARAGAEITLTFAGGTLQSAESVTGPWKDEGGASPLKVQAAAGAKFYRVRGN